jgi:hypothetical protein
LHAAEPELPVIQDGWFFHTDFIRSTATVDVSHHQLYISSSRFAEGLVLEDFMKVNSFALSMLLKELNKHE